MLSLSDQQMKIVQQGAALLPVNARDAFLPTVAGRLTDIEILTDTAVGPQLISFYPRVASRCRAHQTGNKFVPKRKNSHNETQNLQEQNDEPLFK